MNLKFKMLCVLVLLAFALCLGCSEDTEEDENNDVKPLPPISNCYPSSIGSVWQYQDDTGNTSTRKITGTTKSKEGITYKMLEGEIGRLWWTGDTEPEPELFRVSIGGIRLYSEDINNQIVWVIGQDFQQLQGLISNIEIVSAINEWLLIETPLKDGALWTVMLITAKGNILGQKFTITIRINCKALKRKTIEVPAGVFECITLIYTYESTLEMQNEAPDKISETIFKYWLAQDVGIVQIEEEIEGESVTYKLVKYDIK